MSVLTDIGTYLQSEGIGTLGTDIFLSQMPDTPDEAIALFEYAGNAPSRMGGNRQPGIQVRTRGDYETARATIDDIYTLLSKIGNEYEDDAPEGVTINGTTYLHFQTVQEPFPLGPDDNGRHELAQNFIVTYRS